MTELTPYVLAFAGLWFAGEIVWRVAFVWRRAAFGQITTAALPRVVQIAARFDF